MRLLTPKAVEGYASVRDDEACMLVRSLYNETEQGEVPIDSAKLAGRCNKVSDTFQVIEAEQR
jgi:hypothetical protein